MAWVPVIATNRRRNRNNTAVGSVCAVMIFVLLLFGVFFGFVFNMFDGFRFTFTPIIFMGGFFVIFIIIIGIIIATSMSQTYKKPKEQYLKSYSTQISSQNESQIQFQQFNPYINRKLDRRKNEAVAVVEPSKDIPVLSDINFCRFCGAKVDRDAIYCHQCGINLSS